MNPFVTAPARRAESRFRRVAVIAPIAASILAAMAQLAMLPALSGVVAIHWGAGGRPDGFGPAWTFPVLTLAIGVALPVLVGGLALRGGTRGGRLRLLAALVWFASGLLAAISTAGLASQMGVADPRQSPSILPALLGGMVLGAVLGALAWWATIDAPTGADSGRVPDALRVAPGEKAVWLRRASLQAPVMAPLGGAAAILCAAAVAAIAADLASGGELRAASWTLLLAAGVSAAAVLATTSFLVRVDGGGLTVRAALGVPRMNISLDRIADARVVDVDPVGEYGGWGWRRAPGRDLGIVVRAGEAIRITQTDGRMLTVTVDDAATAVALLHGLDDGGTT